MPVSRPLRPIAHRRAPPRQRRRRGLLRCGGARGRRRARAPAHGGPRSRARRARRRARDPRRSALARHRLGRGPGRRRAAGPYRSRSATPLYEAALEPLGARGLTYLCDCSRAEIARVASAPHAGEEGPRYPGTCRPHGMRARAFRRPPAVRLAVPPTGGRDRGRGRGARPLRGGRRGACGDFVLRRGDGVFAYQLAVVVDDLGDGRSPRSCAAPTSRSSAPRQALLARAARRRAARVRARAARGRRRTATGSRSARAACRCASSARRAGDPRRRWSRAIARAYGHASARRRRSASRARRAARLRRALPREPGARIALTRPGRLRCSW